jgi:hypothetical protein
MYYNPYQYYTPPNYSQQNMQPQKNLQGKQVDNIDVVRATEIPFDGSISYFPLTDGSAILTKQLMQDGTSRINVYKPIEEVKEDKLVTQSELEKQINALKEELRKGVINEPDTVN